VKNKIETLIIYLTEKKIISIINSVMRKGYKTTMPVIIRESEIKKIRSVRNFLWQKVLLACLFIIKQNEGRDGIWTNDFWKIRAILGKKHLSADKIQSIFRELLKLDNVMGNPCGYYPLSFVSDALSE